MFRDSLGTRTLQDVNHQPRSYIFWPSLACQGHFGEESCRQITAWFLFGYFGKKTDGLVMVSWEWLTKLSLSHQLPPPRDMFSILSSFYYFLCLEKLYCIPFKQPLNSETTNHKKTDSKEVKMLFLSLKWNFFHFIWSALIYEWRRTQEASRMRREMSSRKLHAQLPKLNFFKPDLDLDDW